MQIIRSRRDFLTTLSAAGAASMLGTRPSLADEPPPETTTIRLGRFFVGICSAPLYVAEALLRAEGFTDVHFVPKPPLDITARGLVTSTLKPRRGLSLSWPRASR